MMSADPGPQPPSLLDSPLASSLGEALIETWRQHRPLSEGQANTLAPADDNAAFAIQREVGDALGWYPHGRPRYWKLGGTLTRPTAGGVADAHVLRAPTTFKASELHTLCGVEVELAVRLNRDLTPEDDLDSVKDAVGSVMAAIEICDVRADNYAHLPATFLLADQQMNRWLLLGGERQGGWQEHDADRPPRLWVNDESRDAVGLHPLGDPLRSLPWLNRIAGDLHQTSLKAGDVITTGTWCGLVVVNPGDTVRASFDGIGDVGFTLSPD